MPGTIVRKIKPWAKVLLAVVTVVRRATGTLWGGSLISFALLYGFVWQPKPTVPGDRE